MRARAPLGRRARFAVGRASRASGGDSRAGPGRAGSDGLVDCVFDVEALADEPAAGEGRAALLLQRPEEAHGAPVRERDRHHLRGAGGARGAAARGLSGWARAGARVEVGCGSCRARAEGHLRGEGAAGLAAREHVHWLHLVPFAADHLAEDWVLGVADEVVERHARCVGRMAPDGCAAHGICEVEAPL